MEILKVKYEENMIGGIEIKFSLVIWEFCDNIIVYGLGRIYFVNYWIRKVFWSLLFIGVVIMFCI